MEEKMSFLNGWTREAFMYRVKQKNPNKRVSNHSTFDECLYRDSHGACCLVGAFIPDSKYHSDMEGKTACEVINNFNLHDDMPLSISKMTELQYIHDELGDYEDLYQKVENYLDNYIVQKTV